MGVLVVMVAIDCKVFGHFIKKKCAKIGKCDKSCLSFRFNTFWCCKRELFTVTIVSLIRFLVLKNLY